MVEGLEHLDYERRLKLIRLQSLENRRLRGYLFETYKIISGKEKVDPSQFFKFSQVKHNLRGHKFKLAVVRSRFEMRRKLFSQRVVEHWNRLRAAVVETIRVNSFKTKLDEWLKI
jgi:hypothetical protein